MPRTREHSEPTRQIYASIREDIYLAAKSRAAELRLPMRRFLEEALVSAISSGGTATLDSIGETGTLAVKRTTVWDDHYIDAQASQPVGSPLDLSQDEARRVALEGFNALNESSEKFTGTRQAHQELRVQGRVGDPVDISEADAAEIAREVLSLNFSSPGEMIDG